MVIDRYDWNLILVQNLRPIMLKWIFQ